MEEITLKDGTTLKVYTREDFLNAMHQKFPNGVNCYIKQLTDKDLYDYVNFGRTEDDAILIGHIQVEHGTDATISLLPEHYERISLNNNVENYWEIYDCLAEHGLQEHIESTIFMNLQDPFNQLGMSVDSGLFDRIAIGEFAINEILPTFLQTTDKDFNRLGLFHRAFVNRGNENLKFHQNFSEMLLNDDWYFKQKNKENQNQLTYWTNETFMTVIEPGTFAMAKVNRDRTAKIYGEQPCENLLEFTKELLNNRNLPVKQRSGEMVPFFKTEPNTIHTRHFLNMTNNQAATLSCQKGPKGEFYYVDQEHNRIYSMRNLKNNFIDVTDHVKDIQIKQGCLFANIDGIPHSVRTNKEIPSHQLNEKAIELFASILKSGFESRPIDRISNITLFERADNTTFIRCAVNNVQQPMVPLDSNDRMKLRSFGNRYGTNTNNPDNPYTKVLQQLATKYFADALNNVEAKEQTKALKI